MAIAVDPGDASLVAAPIRMDLWQSMADIVFATCEEAPALQASDQLVADRLTSRGHRVTPAAWNARPGTPLYQAFESADAVIVRSTWDYVSLANEFLRFIVRLGERAGVYNEPALMRWNLSKRYLARLREMGAPVIPTRFVAPHGPDIGDALDALGLETGLIKPVIGASGAGIAQISRGDAQGLAAAAAGLNASGMVQPLLSQINDIGETSFVFIDGAFSHAVLKIPSAGNILCQEEHGGESRLIDPPDWAIAAAAAVHGLLPGEKAPLYARIDAIWHEDAAAMRAPGVLDGERFLLMEVEVIEPQLFFSLAPEAAERFAAAIERRIS